MASFQKATKYLSLPQLLYGLIIAVLMASCNALDPQQANTQPISHEIFDVLLKKHVDASGLVSYRGFEKDREQLDQYLDLLTDNPPNDQHWTEPEKLAYWINLYNAFTIDLILDHYPVESIKDIGAKVQVPFVNTPWDIKFIEIAGEKYDLNNIEHNILRKIFEEPRIHFAINCASMSCPKLRAEAFKASKLEEQLQEQAVEFLNDPARNLISPDKAEVSKIFQWFSGDFTKSGSLREFLNQYVQQKILEEADIDYMDYEWSINETPN
ncbi:MAG: DUF547 domain-containing protein [Cytophagales bacterium]|nr:DUF547 domain-containing protein [Cytophagales bacterium]